MAGPGIAKSKPKGQARDRQSRSRNTTPISSASVSVSVDMSVRRTMERSVSPYLQTSLTHPPNVSTRLSDSPVADIFDHSSSATNIPSAGALNTIAESIRTQLLSVARLRDEACDRMIRELAQRKKERIERERIRDLEQAKRDADERRLQLKKATTPKKREREEERPLAVGAHGVARQDGRDGSGSHQDTSSPISSVASQPPPSNPEISAKDAIGKESSVDSPTTPHQPAPAAMVRQYQFFGEDPSEFPDSTIYEIREVTPSMTDQEKKEIFSVAEYPPDDLHDLTPGTPPDRDFSSAKPTNQVAAATFINYVEPYLRPLTEEDRAFLQERGDRTRCMEIPKRGPLHYKQAWASEDGHEPDPENPTLPTNEPRGGIEMMNDDVAESDEVSAGPTTARLLSLLRPLTRPVQEEQATAGSMSTEMEMDGEPPSTDPKPESQPPASAFPESTWKNVTHAPRQDYSTMDERVLQELRYIGFLGPTDQPNYSDIADDEVTARLRYLQRELRQTILDNGARKARVLEVALDRMAIQEWQNISDDLDSQLNQAYSKRNRNIGKGKKQVKRPGGPGGGSHPIGVAKPAGLAVGEPVRSLMERRQQWHDLIGPVVEFGKVTIPKETIFDKDSMNRLLAKEQDNWTEELEEA